MIRYEPAALLEVWQSARFWSEVYRNRESDGRNVSIRDSGG